MNAPVKVAAMTPAEDRQGVKVAVDVMYLDDIPKAMDAMGWRVSAQLMRRWFATKPAWAMPEQWREGVYPPEDRTHALPRPIDYRQLPPSQVEDQIVKMQWALGGGFKPALNAWAYLRENWRSPRGIGLLNNKLKRSNYQNGTTHRLGHASMQAKELDYVSQINYVEFGSIYDPLDDFYGAIFKATMKVAVVSKAYRSLFTGKNLFEIDRLGFYIRDTYDFNVSWYEDAFMGLGVWSKKRCLSKAEMLLYKATPLPQLSAFFPGFVPARNTDFRRWQHQRNEGGDFFVFSDVLWETYRGPAIEL